MKTISVSSLKAHLSANLKEVQKGSRIIVLDHTHPIAVLSPVEEEPLFLNEAKEQYTYKKLSPLTVVDPLEKLRTDRADRW